MQRGVESASPQLLPSFICCYSSDHGALYQQDVRAQSSKVPGYRTPRWAELLGDFGPSLLGLSSGCLVVMALLLPEQGGSRGPALRRINRRFFFFAASEFSGCSKSLAVAGTLHIFFNHHNARPKRLCWNPSFVSHNHRLTSDFALENAVNAQSNASVVSFLSISPPTIFLLTSIASAGVISSLRDNMSSAEKTTDKKATPPAATESTEAPSTTKKMSDDAADKKAQPAIEPDAAQGKHPPSLFCCSTSFQHPALPPSNCPYACAPLWPLHRSFQSALAWLDRVAVFKP